MTDLTREPLAREISLRLDAKKDRLAQQRHASAPINYGRRPFMRSVVLPSYQGERFIGEQLDSIIPQLSPDDEIIISDDASTDATLAVVAQRHDKRIRVLSNKTRVGYINNFQRAINQSSGDVIFFSDQDDVWLPAKLQYSTAF